MSPCPEADEPILTVEPGNFSVTLLSTPDSFAAFQSVDGSNDAFVLTRFRGAQAMLRRMGIEIALGLLGDGKRVLSFVFLRHGDKVFLIESVNWGYDLCLVECNVIRM